MAESAFEALGTNAVPYLAARITQDSGYSTLEMWRIKYRRSIPPVIQSVWPLPGSKFSEASSAAELLAIKIKPPGQILVPLLAPAFQSTNEGQRLCGFLALRGISSGHELARPYIERGMKDLDNQVQYWAAAAVGRGSDGKWAVSNLLELAATATNLDVHRRALQALNELETNALPAIPRLKEMLAAETNEERRKIIANAIDYISDD